MVEFIKREFTDEEISGVEMFVMEKLKHILHEIEPKHAVILVTVSSEVTTFKVIRFSFHSMIKNNQILKS